MAVRALPTPPPVQLSATARVWLRARNCPAHRGQAVVVSAKTVLSANAPQLLLNRGNRGVGFAGRCCLAVILASPRLGRHRGPRWGC